MLKANILRVVILLSGLSFSDAFCPQRTFHRPASTGNGMAKHRDIKRVALKASSLEVDIANLSDEPGNSKKATIAVPAETDDVDDALPKEMLTLPRHPLDDVNEILLETEHLIKSMHVHSKKVDPKKNRKDSQLERGESYDAIFANTYVDLGKVDTVGFDYDYTLVTYTEELLELIYDMALKRLVHDRQYPMEMLDAGLSFDPFFSIRGTFTPEHRQGGLRNEAHFHVSYLTIIVCH
jgi:hypothetical protein